MRMKTDSLRKKKKISHDTSSPVAVSGVVAAQGLLLGLGQALETVVALAGGAEPVLAHAVQNTEDGEADGDELADQVDGVAGEVLGSVGGDVCPPVISSQ